MAEIPVGSSLSGRSSFESKRCIVCHVLVALLLHFPQLRHNLCLESFLVNACFILLDNTRAAELHVRDAISTCFDESGHDHLSNITFVEDWHDDGKGLESAHPIVESLLVHVVTVDDLGDQA